MLFHPKIKFQRGGIRGVMFSVKAPYYGSLNSFFPYGKKVKEGMSL